MTVAVIVLASLSLTYWATFGPCTLRRCVAHRGCACYTYFMARASSRTTATRSFRIDPKLVAAARRAIGAADDTEAVRVALAELVERAKFKSWVQKVAGKGRLDGADR